MAPPVVADVGLPSAGRVMSIQSHTVHGYIGNKAAVFPLQLLGFDVDLVNSVQFSNHTVCDLVMGDDGKFFVKPELLPVYREKVVLVATMITPNAFEAEQLTGRCIEIEAEALQMCVDLHAAGPSKVVITSIVINGMITLIGSHLQSKGPGDLMTALLLGWSHKFPDDLDKAVVSSLQAVLKNTVAGYKAGSSVPKPQSKQLELRLIQSANDIQSPVTKFFAEDFI